MTDWRKAANGEMCTIQLPGCQRQGTTILAHWRNKWNAGTGTKPPDQHGAFACQSCHDILDGRNRAPFDLTAHIPDDQLRMHLRRLMLQQSFWEGHLRTLDRMALVEGGR